MRGIQRHAGKIMLAAAALILWAMFALQAVGSAASTAQAVAALALGALLEGALAAALLRGTDERTVMTGLLFTLLALYAAVFPLGHMPDEREHLLRAYEVSQGGLTSARVGEAGEGGNVLPAALERYTDPEARIDPADTSELIFANTSLYAPLCYLPQAIGIRAARLATDRVQAMVYAARAANALTAFALCALAIRWMPCCKKTFFLLLALPVSLQSMVSLSPDSLTIAASALWTAYVLRCSRPGAAVRRGGKALLLALALTLSLCKIIYIVLCALVLLIPAENLGGRRRANIFKIALLAAAAAANLLWLGVSVGYLTEFRPGVDPGAQAVYLLTHPHQYVLAVLRTVLSMAEIWVGTVTGQRLGRLDIFITPFVWIAFYTLFLCCLLAEERPAWNLRPGAVALLIGVFAVGSALILTSEYVQWTPLAAKSVEGVQGRYFLPLAAPLLTAFAALRPQRPAAAKSGAYRYLLILMLNGIALAEMLRY